VNRGQCTSQEGIKSKTCLYWIFADMSGRTNCIRFPKMLPKLVVLCSSSSESELSSAGYIASKSSHPNTAYFCEVFNCEYGDEVCQAFPVPSI